MNKPNVLIIVDEKDAHFLDVPIQNEHWAIFSKVIDYDEIHERICDIKKLVLERDIDFVLYSRNDQVANRINIGSVTRYLRTGYSSFSGIDEKNRIEQMRMCFGDFISCDKRLSFDSIDRFDLLNNGGTHHSAAMARARDWTFSLVFDVEQLGCARYGLPRILPLLDKYGVKATFFVTNLLKKVYPNILEALSLRKHEIGLHGLWHEYLCDLSEKMQMQSLRGMVNDFGYGVYGANFLGRMNTDTIRVLMHSRLGYFVYPSTNQYYLTAYLKFPTTPGLVHLENETIWMIPISIETYGLPWISIRNMIDSITIRSNQFHHISILCHPFRDGNLAHIHTLEKLVCHLLRKGVKPVTLRDMVSGLSDDDYFPSLSANCLNGSFNPRHKLALPQTKEDFLGIVPENIIAIYRRIKHWRAYVIQEKNNRAQRDRPGAE